MRVQAEFVKAGHADWTATGAQVMSVSILTSMLDAGQASSCRRSFGHWCLDSSGLSHASVLGIIVGGAVFLLVSCLLLAAAVLVWQKKKRRHPTQLNRHGRLARVSQLRFWLSSKLERQRGKNQPAASMPVIPMQAQAPSQQQLGDKAVPAPVQEPHENDACLDAVQTLDHNAESAGLQE